MNKNLRKNKIILPIVIILTLVVLIGGTYAIFARVDEANIANNYKTGNLHIVIDDTSEGLGGNLNLPSIPLSDEEGSTLEPYKFKVINKGNLWYEYDLKLLKDMITTETDGCSEKQIPLNYIKVRINDEEPQLLSELENNTIIQDEILPPLKENYYEVRIWLDESAPNSVIGSHFHGKITTEGYAIQPFDFVNNFEYTGDYQEYIVPYNGIYQIELWGAEGGNKTAKSGKGTYVSGIMELSKGEIFYIYIGGQGNISSIRTGGYNGGGIGGSGNWPTAGGGGATDIRCFGYYNPTDEELLWDSIIGLRSRIMVASGGSTEYANRTDATTNNGGGISSQAGRYAGAATQTSGGVKNSSASSGTTGGSFGKGGNGGNGGSWGGGGAGGGGYYGGSGGSGHDGGNGYYSGGTSGSSFISGHTGCVAITSSESTTARTGTDGASCTTGTADNLCSIHYSGKYFTDTLMIDGAGYTWTNVKAYTVGTNLMPNPLGDYYASGVGHSGNGYARITFVG